MINIITEEELVVKITANTAGLKSGLAGVKAQVSSMDGAVKKSTAGINKSFNKAGRQLLTGLGITASLALITRFGKACVAAAGDVSNLYGVMSEEELAEWNATLAQFNAQWETFKATVGAILIQILIPLTQAITQVLNALNNVGNRVFQVFRKSRIEIDKTTKSAKAMKSQTGFDELNTVKTDDTQSIAEILSETNNYLKPIATTITLLASAKLIKSIFSGELATKITTIGEKIVKNAYNLAKLSPLTALKKTKDAFVNLGRIIKAVFVFDKAILLKDLAPIAAKIKTFFTSVFAALSAQWAAFITKLSGVGTTIMTAIKGIGSALAGVLTSPITWIIAAVALIVAGFIHAYKTSDEFREKADNAFKILKLALNDLKTAIQPLIDAFRPFIDLFVEIGQKVKDFITNLMPQIKEMIANFTAQLKEFMENIGPYLRELLTGIATILRELWDWLAPILGTVIIGLIKGLALAIGTIAKAISSVIGFLDKLIAKVRAFFDLLDSRDDDANIISGFSMKKIFRGTTYASGGFPEMGQIFVAREAGPEMVGTIGNQSAVANNTQITTAIASAVYNAITKAGGMGGSTNVTLELDGTKIGQSVVDYHNNMVKRTGRSPLLV